MNGNSDFYFSPLTILEIYNTCLEFKVIQLQMVNLHDI